MEVVLGKGLTGKLEAGVLKLEFALAEAAVPMLDGIIVKINAGEIDPVKGTDMDKEIMLKVLNAIKAALV